MAPSFRDRFFTPVVARAITSPSGILLAGAGAAAGILLGLGPAAALVGLGAWAARVGAAIPRGGPSSDRIDLFRIGEPWRRMVMDAQRAQRRFDETAARCRPGPLRERLTAVGERVGDAVRESWRIAQRGDEIDDALRNLGIQGIEAELAEVHEERREHAGNRDADTALYRTQQALEAQLATAQRLRSVALDAQNRLRLLNAQLDEAVARSVEISLEAGDVQDLGALGAEVESVVGELEALRQGLEEASGRGGRVMGGTPGTGVPGTA
ncbi:MAG TPA: hypothetical protein VF230_19390 [Acidimicrobiales bacterium]